MLLLIGSDVAMMERFSQHDRPLFGRAQPLVVPALGGAEVASPGFTDVVSALSDPPSGKPRTATPVRCRC